MSQQITVNIPVKIRHEVIADLISSALNSGISYWCSNCTVKLGPNVTKEIINTKYNTMWYASYVPFFPDSFISFQLFDVECFDGEIKVLNIESITKGLEILANKYNNHFSNIIEENYDAETADVFIQCCIFGDIIFG